MNLPESDSVIMTKTSSADEVSNSGKLLVTETAPNNTSQKWEMKSFRDYVWLDIAIDDVVIGRITAEV